MKKLFTTGVAVLSLSACATIIGSTTQPVTFKSTPEGATVTITNRAGEKIHTGITPATVTLNRGAGYFKAESYPVTFQKDGYEAQEVVVAGNVNGWYFGNIIFGGLVLGMLIVDPLSGAMFTLDSDKVDLALKAVDAKTSKADGSLTIVMRQDVPDDIMKFARQVNCYLFGGSSSSPPCYLSRPSHFSAPTISEQSIATAAISTHSTTPIGAVWNSRFITGR